MLFSFTTITFNSELHALIKHLLCTQGTLETTPWGTDTPSGSAYQGRVGPGLSGRPQQLSQELDSRAALKSDLQCVAFGTMDVKGGSTLVKVVRHRLWFFHVSSHMSTVPLAISIGHALRLTKTLGGSTQLPTSFPRA